MANFYGEQLKAFEGARESGEKKYMMELASEFIDTDSKKISWSRGLVADLGKGKTRPFNKAAIRQAAYRPFTKQWVYFDRAYNDMIYKQWALFPTPQLQNIAICTTSAGNRGDFSTLIAKELPDLNYCGTGSAAQCFPLYLYEKADESSDLPFDKSEIIDGYRRRDAITDGILQTFREAYGKVVTKEDIFYYVYGVLHSPEYRRRFASDLKKMLPRVPLTKEIKDFWHFSQAGRDLAHWHLNYETVEPWPVQESPGELFLDPAKDFLVQKMFFGRSTAEQKARGEKVDKTTIQYNARIMLAGIPLEAYEYIVNGKPAIEWIMERYQVTVDKDSGIRNDPNDWAREHNEPRYILDLLKRVVTVSMETMKLLRSLPALNERTSKTSSAGG
jgi:predicted helicase